MKESGKPFPVRSWVAGLMMIVCAACGGGDDGSGGAAPEQDSLVCGDSVTGVTVYEPDKCDAGYSLLASLGGHENPPGSHIYHGAILIDMQGRLVHEWGIVGIPAKLLPNGHLLGFRAVRRDGTIHQEMDALVELDWDGREVWSWHQWGRDARGRSICRGHHDFQREGLPEACYAPRTAPLPADGKTLVLVHSNVDRPEIAPWILEDDVILEVNSEGAILWEWHASDHFEEFGFDTPARQALQTIQVFVPPDALTLEAGITDWLHTNTISSLGPNKWWDQGDERFNPENILASSRNANILWIIEKSTGNIVWKVGPDYGLGRPEGRLGQFIGQHHPHMIAKGLPGAGNILVFDNGGLAGYGRMFEIFGRPFFPNKARTFSRVVEFNPVTLDIAWEYRRPGTGGGAKPPFFSIYISGAQRLPNGNTLITDGDGGRVFEVTPSGETVWEYLSPYHDHAYDLFTLPGQRCMTDIYRAYRIPYDYIPKRLIEENEGLN